MAFDNSHIHSSIRKLRKSLKRASKRLAPEDVHKLRTRIRRFAALHKAIGLADQRNSRRLLRPLNYVRKKAGRIRDMDVLTVHLASLHSDTDQSCLTQLFEYLGAKRYRHAARLRRFLRNKGPSLRKKLRRVSARLKGNRGRNNYKDSEAHAEVAAQVLQMAADLAQPAQLTKANLHPYRLKVKKFRDVIAMSAGGGDPKFADALAKCKDAIGEWHDWEELIAIAGKRLHHGLHCSLLGELKATSKRKLDAALSIAGKFRKSYIRLPGGKQADHPPKSPLPALKTVSSLVP